MAAPHGAPRRCRSTRDGRHVGLQAQIEGREEVEGPGEESREDARCVWMGLYGEEEWKIMRACAGGVVKEEWAST